MVQRPEPFRVDVRPERERVRITPIGEVDLVTAPRLEDRLRELADSGFDWLRLDLARVSFMDCAGLRVLATARSRARLTGARLDVLHAQGQVARLLALDIVDQSPAPEQTPRVSRTDALAEPVVDVRDDADAHAPLPLRAREPLATHELSTGIGRRS